MWCTSEVIGRIRREDGTYDPVEDELLILACVDLIGMSSKKAWRAEEDAFAFYGCFKETVEEAEAIELSFSTPHDWTRYDPLVSNEETCAKYGTWIWSRAGKKATSNPKPTEWWSKRWEAERLSNLIPADGDPLEFTKNAILDMSDGRISKGLDVSIETATPDRKLKKGQFGHHTVEIRGDMEYDDRFFFGVVGYNGKADPIPGGDKDWSCKAPLYYMEVGSAQNAYGAKHPWGPNPTATVPYLFLNVSLLTHSPITVFHPGLEEFRRTPISTPRGRSYVDGRWCAVYGPYEDDDNALKEMNRTRFKVEPPETANSRDRGEGQQATTYDYPDHRSFPGENLDQTIGILLDRKDPIRYNEIRTLLGKPAGFELHHTFRQVAEETRRLAGNSEMKVVERERIGEGSYAGQWTATLTPEARKVLEEKYPEQG